FTRAVAHCLLEWPLSYMYIAHVQCTYHALAPLHVPVVMTDSLPSVGDVEAATESRMAAHPSEARSCLSCLMKPVCEGTRSERLTLSASAQAHTKTAPTLVGLGHAASLTHKV